MAIFLPFYFIRFNIFEKGSVNLLDLALIVFLAGFGLCLFDKKFRNEFGKYCWAMRGFIAPAALIILGCFLSYAMALGEYEWTRGIGVMKSFYVLPFLFALAGGFFWSRNEKLFLRFLGIYFFTSSVIAVWGVAAILGGNLTYDGRLTLGQWSPNQLAIYLAPGLLLAWFFLKKTRKNKGWLFFLLIALTAAHFACIYTTKSLGSWLGLLGAGGFLFAAGQFKPGGRFDCREKIFLWVLGFWFIALAGIFLTGPGIKKMDYSPFVSHNSLDSRLVIYMSSLKIIRDNWLWGIGPGNFLQAYLDYQKFFPPYPQWAVPHAHNLLLNFWLEAGLAGVAGFFWLFFRLIRACSFLGGQKAGKIRKADRSVTLAGSIIIYFLAHGIFDTTFWRNDFSLMFFSMLAVYFAYCATAFPKDNKEINLLKEAKNF